MFDIHNYFGFIAAILAFQCVPGPGTLIILKATARNGVLAGVGAVFGTLLGDFIYMTGAVLGLAAVMATYPLAFEALQWFGVVFLCWMGVKLLWSQLTGEQNLPVPQHGSRLYFRQACMVSLTNPKVMLFFMAFFPLFLSPGATIVTLVAMMAHVIIISMVYQALLVLAGNSLAQKLRSWPLARRVATRLAGVALIGFGIKLAANNR